MGSETGPTFSVGVFSMKCPACDKDIPKKNMSIELEGDEVEVVAGCDECMEEFISVLKKEDFK